MKLNSKIRIVIMILEKNKIMKYTFIGERFGKDINSFKISNCLLGFNPTSSP